MKINLLISIFLIFLFKISSAQQSELINNTWNLEKVILNDIEHYFPNSINTINATANFTSNYFNSHICNTLSADTTLSNDLIISIPKEIDDWINPQSGEKQAYKFVSKIFEI